MRRALTAVVNRPENAAERQIREAREQGRPNRLQTFLNHTPQEYAAEILHLASPKYAKEESIVLQGQVKLREIFQQVSDTISVTFMSSSSRPAQPNLIVTLNLKGEEKRIVVEVKSSAEPRYLRESFEQLKKLIVHSASAYGLFIVPAISERSRKICEYNDVGYIDLQGNAFVKFEGVFIKTTATNKEVRKRGRTKSLFAPVSTRLIRVLLAEPQRSWKLQELTKVAHLSLGQTHKVKQELLDQEFIDSVRGKGLFLKDASGLLNAWQQKYDFEKNVAIPLFSLDKIPVIEEKIRQYCASRKIGYAFTLFSGASKLAPFVRYNVVAFYFAGDQEELQRELNLKPVDSGANILLLSPYDEGVWYRLQENQGCKIVSTIQLYLDLFSYGGRGREQAEFIREKLLGF